MTIIGRNSSLGRSVRGGRGAQFNPLALGGCVAWADFADLDSITLNGSNVAAIRNKAGTGSWTQGTGGNQDPYEPTGLNGMPCWHGTGVNGHDLKSSEAQVWQALAGSLPYTLFIVGAVDIADDSLAFFGVGNSGVATNQTRYWGNNTSGTGRWMSQTINDAGTTSNETSAGATNTSPHIFCWSSPGTTVSLRTDGASPDPNGAAQNPGTLTPNQSALGSRPDNSEDFELDGRLGEVILFNRELSASEIAQVNVYLGTKWNLYNPLLEGNCVAWFDMQDPTSFTDSTGFVSAITNKATAVSWTEATNRPAYAATGLNGRPCMDFDGTNDRIQSTTDTAVINTFASNTPLAVYYVAQFDTVDRSENIFNVANSGSNSGFRGFGQNTTNAGVWLFNGNNGGSVNLDSTGGSNGNPNVFEWSTPDGINISLRVNGGAPDPNAGSANVGTITVNRASLGNRPRTANDSFFDGKLGELLIFNAGLSDAGLARVRAYLGSRWGIASA